MPFKRVFVDKVKGHWAMTTRNIEKYWQSEGTQGHDNQKHWKICIFPYMLLIVVEFFLLEEYTDYISSSHQLTQIVDRDIFATMKNFYFHCQVPLVCPK